jgi:hypothetical protein
MAVQPACGPPPYRAATPDAPALPLAVAGSARRRLPRGVLGNVLGFRLAFNPGSSAPQQRHQPSMQAACSPPHYELALQPRIAVVPRPLMGVARLPGSLYVKVSRRPLTDGAWCFCYYIVLGGHGVGDGRQGQDVRVLTGAAGSPPHLLPSHRPARGCCWTTQRHCGTCGARWRCSRPPLYGACMTYARWVGAWPDACHGGPRAAAAAGLCAARPAARQAPACSPVRPGSNKQQQQKQRRRRAPSLLHSGAGNTALHTYARAHAHAD